MNQRQWRRCSLFFCWAVTLCSACGRIGEPLVDRRPPPKKIPGVVLDCHAPPACADVVGLPKTPTQPALAPRVDLAACGGADARRCGASPVDFSDGGTGSGVSGCDTTWSLDGQSAPAQSSLAYECSQVRIVAEGSVPAGRAQLGAVQWERTNVSIEAQRPLTLELDGAALRDVFIELSGPVTLRFTHSLLFHDVRITTAQTSVGVQRIELTDFDATGLVVRGSDHFFEGTLALTRISLTKAELVATDLSLESVLFESGSMDALTMNAADTHLTSVQMKVQSGLLSACVLSKVRVSECGALTLLECPVAQSQISACTDPPLRIYGSSLLDSAVDGEIQSDTSTFNHVALGVHQPTDLLMWAGDMLASNFCAASRSARFGANASVGCTACEQGGLAEPGAACSILPLSEFLNPCPALASSAARFPKGPPPACPDPLPERERPAPDPAPVFAPAGGEAVSKNSSTARIPPSAAKK